MLATKGSKEEASLFEKYGIKYYAFFPVELVFILIIFFTKRIDLATGWAGFFQVIGSLIPIQDN